MSNALAGDLAPPGGVVMSAEALVYWPRIVASRPRDRWDDYDLTNAAELCRMFADVERFRAIIATEGDFDSTGNKPHPAHKLLEAAGRRAISLSRVLQVTPEAKVGRSRDAGNSLRQEQQARTAASVDDDLIPGARVQ